MVLADTSLWIEHFRGRGPRLAGLLEQSAILMHPVIEGELAYAPEPLDAPAEGNALICCARPITAVELDL